MNWAVCVPAPTKSFQKSGASWFCLILRQKLSCSAPTLLLFIPTPRGSSYMLLEVLLCPTLIIYIVLGLEDASWETQDSRKKGLSLSLLTWLVHGPDPENTWLLIVGPDPAPRGTAASSSSGGTEQKHEPAALSGPSLVLWYSSGLAAGPSPFVWG